MEKTERLVIKLVVIAVLMFGFGFALVPLYRVFCEITGLNGKTNAEAVTALFIPDISRSVTVQFVTTLNENMPWEFKPFLKTLIVHPGESAQVLFSAKNLSAKTMVAQAVPSVSPGFTAQYFKKTECFCFNRQTLKAGEAIEMPVVFMLDPALPSDQKEITLSYTLFDVTNKQPLLSERKGTL